MAVKSKESPAAWLITGCSSGIGREIALAALAKGRRVAVTARKPAAVEDIVAKHPDRGVALALALVAAMIAGVSRNDIVHAT